MRRFPLLQASLALEEGFKCSRCPVVIRPFAIVYVVARAVDRPHSGKGICERCFKKEMEQRANVLRDDRACIKRD